MAFNTNFGKRGDGRETSPGKETGLLFFGSTAALSLELFGKKSGGNDVVLPAIQPPERRKI